MASMNFQPGGAEDDDEFDEDGFYIGDSKLEELTETKPLDSVSAVSSSHVNREGFKGFGTPKPKVQSQSGKSFKRPSDRHDGNTRTLDMGDFQMAIVRRRHDLVKQYLDEGFKVDTVLKSGWTGLMYAASNANAETVYELLHHSADPNFHKDMYTVLMAACGAAGYSEQDVLQCVTMLLEKGAKLDACDRYHTTALMYAAKEGRSTVIRQLVERGANVNKQNNRGWTALTWAVSKQRIDAVRTLLEDNADPKLKHCDGQTVLDMAIQMEDEQIVALLEGRDPDTSGVSRHAVSKTSAQNGVSTSKHSDNQTSISVESSGTTYGELELFLCGLELSSLVDLFRDQKVTFSDFLLMTEEDLIQMGISQLGIRKKIIDGIHAVHKKEWEKSSLPAIQYNKQLSCAECIAMVANIAKHTKYITTTVNFLQDQLKKKPDILDELQDSTGPKQLHQHTVDTCQNITVLENQLKTLKLQLSKTLKTGNFNPPDLIKKPVSSEGRSGRVIALIFSASVLSVVVWNRQFLTEKFVELIMPIR